MKKMIQQNKKNKTRGGVLETESDQLASFAVTSGAKLFQQEIELKQTMLHLASVVTLMHRKVDQVAAGYLCKTYEKQKWR